MTPQFATALRQARAAVKRSNPLEATLVIQQALGGQLHREPRDTYVPQRRTGLAESLDALRVLKEPYTAKSATNIPVAPNFQQRTFACPVGQRNFRLFIPSTTNPRGLIVMLHGCNQTADDFARGTKMNEVAERSGLVVAYPWQEPSANPSSCWNWFRPQDQLREGGEAEIIAGLTQVLCDEFRFSPRNVFVAGLSAGGAMAAVMGATYPDLYAAVGVHSGLPYKSANDVASAFAAMRGQRKFPSPLPESGPLLPRLIVFHGRDDQTVSVANAASLWEAAMLSRSRGELLEQTSEINGLTVDRRTFSAEDRMPAIDAWIIHGAGHAWSGGNPEASYANARGPDASEEMARFFLSDSTSMSAQNNA